MNLALFRCEQDGTLLRKDEALKGKCLGHRIKPATTGTFLEWLRVKYWIWTGKL